MNSSEVAPISGLLEGKYELVGMIGRGGMGSVWEAKHHTLGTRFAIKFIEAEYADSKEARDRFDKEARAAATIQSKHAIQIYDHGVTRDGKPFIVMELLVGEPLDKRLERMGRMSLQDTARVLSQVSRGLARAHEKGIVHRDLKPENVFLVRSSEDDEEIAKVLDFGIAKITGDATNPSVTSSTKTGAVLGTPFYMSPEQARGLRNVDHRTDVWSLGVIAFKCVTGKLPFDGESVGDLLVKICTAPVPVPSQAIPGLPASFDAWFMRALEREPDRRFQTVTELADGLAYAAGMTPRGASPFSGQVGSGQQATVAAGHPQQIIVTPPPGAMPPYATPNPALKEAGAATAAPFTSSTPVPGVPQPGRAKYFVFAALAGLLVAGGAGGGFIYMKKHALATGDNAVGIAPAPPPSSAAVDPPPPASSDVKPPDTTPPASAVPLAQNNPKDTSAKNAGLTKAGAKAGGGAAPAKGALTGHDTTATAPPLPHETAKPATTVPPPAKTSHPANKDDPGY